MLLHRFGLLQFPILIPNFKSWGYTTGEGVSVCIDAVHNSTDSSRVQEQQSSISFQAPQRYPVAQPTALILRATLETDYEFVPPYEIIVSDDCRKSAERALSEMASVIGIISETSWTLASPRPYLAISAESEGDRSCVRSAKRIVVPAPHSAPPFHGRGPSNPFDVANLLSDRPDGVLLLGSAVRAAAGISKLHELFRLFENAFGCGGIRLTEPLTAFLQGATRTSGRYTKSEIKMWINELRHPATHADLQKSKRVAYDPEVEPYLYRIEQAAYDVLFNKADWGAPGYARKNRWSFSAIVNQDGSFVVSPGATFRTSTPLDHFQAFPLAEVARLSLSTPNDDWLMGDWYFSEEDWQSFKVKD